MKLRGGFCESREAFSCFGYGSDRSVASEFFFLKSVVCLHVVYVCMMSTDEIDDPIALGILSRGVHLRGWFAIFFFFLHRSK